MRAAGVIATIVVLIAGCSTELGPEYGNGPIFPVQDELHEWVTPDKADPKSDRAPVIADPVVTFQLEEGEQRSALLYGDKWRTGFPFLAGFDLRIEGALPEDPILISRFFRSSAPAAELVTIALDAERGVTFRGQTCIPASDLNDWNRVEFRIKLTDRDIGYLEIFCNREPLWGVTETRTTFAIPCRRREGCTQELPPGRPKFHWHLGLIGANPVAQGVTLEMRRLHQRELLYVPNRIE